MDIGKEIRRTKIEPIPVSVPAQPETPSPQREPRTPAESPAVPEETQEPAVQ